MTNDATENHDATRRDGSRLSEGLGAAVPKRDKVALWGNIVLLHLWGAVNYLKPGWFPMMAGVVQVVLLLAMYRAMCLREKLARQQSA